MYIRKYLKIPSLIFLLLSFFSCQAHKNLVDTNSIVFLEFKKENMTNNKDEYTAKFIKNNEIIAKLKFVDGETTERFGKIPDGLTVVLYDTGEVRSISSYKDQNRHGIATSYFKDGTLEHIVFYDNGIPTGESVIYYPDGSVHVEMKYENGKELYYRQYDTEGNIEFEKKQTQ
jgi:antitoxin component YwqK of YwqJK toxin-antitoxin module